jgi:hypothetical protein
LNVLSVSDCNRVRRATYQRVTHRLFNREDRREFSELVEELLQNWLRKH